MIKEKSVFFAKIEELILTEKIVTNIQYNILGM